MCKISENVFVKILFFVIFYSLVHYWYNKYCRSVLLCIIGVLCRGRITNAC